MYYEILYLLFGIRSFKNELRKCMEHKEKMSHFKKFVYPNSSESMYQAVELYKADLERQTLFQRVVMFKRLKQVTHEPELRKFLDDKITMAEKELINYDIQLIKNSVR